MDLVSVDPQLNMYDEQWPIRTYQPNLPPPKFVFAEPTAPRATPWTASSAWARSSPAAQVERSILGPRARVNSFAQVEDSILFDGVDIGRHAKVRRAIIDKGVCIPAGVQIGYDRELDIARGFTVTESGVTVIAQSFAEGTFGEGGAKNSGVDEALEV